MKLLARFFKDDAGATVIEYCLIASLISVAILLAINGLAGSLNETFTQVSTVVK